MLNIKKAEQTIAINVLVQFRQADGSLYQGDFKGEFKRLPVAEIDELLESEASNSEVVDRVLIGVSGIGDGTGNELPAPEALAWVKASPECVNAAVAAFFRELRPERYNEKTSKKRR